MPQVADEIPRGAQRRILAPSFCRAAMLVLCGAFHWACTVDGSLTGSRETGTPGSDGGSGHAVGGNGSAGTPEAGRPSFGGATGSAGSANTGGSGLNSSGGVGMGGGSADGGFSSSGAANGGFPSGGMANGGTANGGSSSGGMSPAGGNNGSSGSSGSTSDPYGDARTRCVDRTNALRATLGLKPIPRLATAEPCADGQAKADSISGKAHSAFNACLNQVKWTGAAQNECPGWDSVESSLGGCLDAMWAEGPGGGHYDNMTGNSTKMACGIYTTPSGKVWLVQDFWTE